jgi:hypothetical protein
MFIPRVILNLLGGGGGGASGVADGRDRFCPRVILTLFKYNI